MWRALSSCTSRVMDAILMLLVTEGLLAPDMAAVRAPAGTGQRQRGASRGVRIATRGAKSGQRGKSHTQRDSSQDSRASSASRGSQSSRGGASGRHQRNRARR